jgi:hypothetical protein
LQRPEAGENPEGDSFELALNKKPAGVKRQKSRAFLAN